MKNCKNTSSGDVSSTSKTSQSLTNSSQALRTASSSSFGLCRSSHNKISQTLLNLDHSLSRTLQTCRSFKKRPNCLLSLENPHMQKLLEKNGQTPFSLQKTLTCRSSLRKMAKLPPKSNFRLVRRVCIVLIFILSLSQPVGLASHPLSATLLG